MVGSIPTSAHACGLLSTILWGILSDKLQTRPPIAFAITICNIVSCSVLAAAPSIGGIFFGYILNAATYSYGPIMIVCSPKAKKEDYVPSPNLYSHF